MRDIRPYSLFDLAELIILWESAARQSHPFLPETFFAKQKYAIPNGYIPNSKTWVYTINSKVVGFISLVGTEVAALFVDPDYHRLGVGRALLDMVKSQCNHITLEVFEANTKGIAFYEAYGFRKTASRPYQESGEQLLELSLDVTGSDAKSAD